MSFRVIGPDEYFKIVMSLLSVGMLAFVSHVARMNTYLRLETIRNQDEQRGRELVESTKRLDESYKQAQELNGLLEHQARVAKEVINWW